VHFDNKFAYVRRVADLARNSPHSVKAILKPSDDLRIKRARILSRRIGKAQLEVALKADFEFGLSSAHGFLMHPLRGCRQEKLGYDVIVAPTALRLAVMKSSQNVPFRNIPVSERLGLSRVEAAEYVGFSVDLFDEMVKDGRMPKPKLGNNKKVWPRFALEKAFVELPEEGQISKADPWRGAA
jgi:predicted DNA-binding transcriptional regulator AlpA